MKDKSSRIQSGPHSINLGTGNSVENSHLQIVHNHGSLDARPIAIIDRVYSKPVSFLGSPVKSGWLVISGVVGFIGSIASIVGLSQHLSVWLVLLLSLTGFSLIVGVNLARHRFIRVPYSPFNLEADRQGKIYLTKVEGDCPLCDGKLKLRDIGPKEHKITYVRCSRNPNHLWNFDFTVLQEPGN
jgi:hypothetical protein